MLSTKKYSVEETKKESNETYEKIEKRLKLLSLIAVANQFRTF